MAALGLVALAACGGRAVDQPNGLGGAPTDAGVTLDSGQGGAPMQLDADVPPDASEPVLDASAAGAFGEAGAGGAAPISEAGAGGVLDRCEHFATRVVDYAFGGGQNHGQASSFPQAVLGPPVANDPSAVVSLGNGGWVVLELGASTIVDGPGVDFTVFENPLGSFKELATVSVSEDAINWTDFPCTVVPVASEPTDYGTCAGVNVVYSSPKNGIDPLDPTVSGGDHYDLADIGVTRARYVRITDRVDLVGNNGVFDLDAVASRHVRCD